jgi:hypothetical protein
MAHGYTQSYTDGVREAEGVGYTVVSRTSVMPRRYQEEVADLSIQEKTTPRAPQGPDPKGAPFLPFGHWAGIVDGYIFKTAEKGMGYYKNGEPTKHFSDMNDEELISAAFIEGVPGGEEKDSTDLIMVYMDEEEFQAPVGRVKTEPFIELFWRKTGADCDGEEDEMEFPNGKIYTIVLNDTRKTR